MLSKVSFIFIYNDPMHLYLIIFVNLLLYCTLTLLLDPLILGYFWANFDINGENVPKNRPTGFVSSNYHSTNSFRSNLYKNIKFIQSLSLKLLSVLPINHTVKRYKNHGPAQEFVPPLSQTNLNILWTCLRAILKKNC